MRSILFAVSCGLAVCVSAAPNISNVSVVRSSAFAKKVTVGYDLTSEDAIVTFDVLTNGVSIGAANVVSVSGDVNRKVSTTRFSVRCLPPVTGNAIEPVSSRMTTSAISV